MTENGYGTTSNTLLDITNSNGTHTPNKLISSIKSSFKSVLKQPNTSTPTNPAVTNTTEFNDQSTQVLNILDQATNDIKLLLQNTQQQYKNVQQQYNTLNNEHNQLIQHNHATESQLNTIKHDTDQYINDMYNKQIQHKHTQNLRVLNRLHINNNTLMISTIYNQWKLLHYQSKFNRQTRLHQQQINDLAQQLNIKYSVQVDELTQTIKQQQSTIDQFRITELQLYDKLKSALLKSVCAVNQEALAVLNDPLYKHINEIELPNNCDNLPQPNIKSNSHHGTIPHTVKKVINKPRSHTTQPTVLKQIQSYKSAVFK